MVGDPYQFWQQMNRASNSAFMAVPAEYRMLDQLASISNQFTSSANLSFDEPFTETDLLRIGDSLREGSNMRLEQEIMQILAGGIMQNFYGGGSDPISSQARQQYQQDLIEQKIKAYTALKEHRFAALAEVRAYQEHQKEITQQNNRLDANDMASSGGTSEEKKNAQQEVNFATLMHPEDLELNA